MFVATEVLSRQKWYLWQLPANDDQGLGKPSEVETNECRIYNKRLLLAGSETLDTARREENTAICCDKSFVATKMILVAAPANDNQRLGQPSEVETSKCRIYNKRSLLAGSKPCTRPGEKRT